MLLARRFPFPSTTARLCTWYPAPTPSPSAPHHVMCLHSYIETPASHSLPCFKGTHLPCPSSSFREVAASFLTQDQPLPVRYLNQSSFWFLLWLIQQIPLEPLFWARCWATHGTQGDTHTSSRCSRNPQCRAPTAPPASLGSCPHPVVQVFPMAPHLPLAVVPASPPFPASLQEVPDPRLSQR